jgi:hypothetical protein
MLIVYSLTTHSPTLLVDFINQQDHQIRRKEERTIQKGIRNHGELGEACSKVRFDLVTQ